MSRENIENALDALYFRATPSQGRNRYMEFITCLGSAAWVYAHNAEKMAKQAIRNFNTGRFTGITINHSNNQNKP
jgi:hypothetical protein